MPTARADCGRACASARGGAGHVARPCMRTRLLFTGTAAGFKAPEPVCVQALAAHLLEVCDDLPMALAVAADMWLAHSRLFGSEAEALCDIRDWTCRGLVRQPSPDLSGEQRTLHLNQVSVVSCSAKCRCSTQHR